MVFESQAEAVRRLKSIEGHVRGVTRMVEQEQHCTDIIRQIRAIQGALHKLNLLLLETHVQQCVTTAVCSEDDSEREQVIRELLGLFETSQGL